MTGYRIEPIAWLYQSDLYHPSCIVAKMAPPTMAAYCMTTTDPESVQLDKAHQALGLPEDYSDCLFVGDDATWPTNESLGNLYGDETCIECRELILPEA